MNDEIKEFIEFRVDEDGTYFYYIDKNGDEQWSYNLDNLKDYITNLQQENKRLQQNNYDMQREMAMCWQKIDKAIEYITSYEAISTIQGLDRIEQNKTLDERTMNVMVERYLQVHHNLLNILQNRSDDNG